MITVGSNWTIRPYESGDEVRLVDLFARVFKRPITTAHWLWKFRGYELPFQNVWLAVDGEKIIFQCAGIPVRMMTTKGSRWGVQFVDAMGDPEYRRRGVLTGVARHAYDYWRENGAACVYGLPNEQAGPGLDKLGLKTVSAVRWRRYPIRPFAILARRIGVAVPTNSLDALWFALRPRRDPRPGVHLLDVSHADATFDRIWTRLACPGMTTVIRNSDWVRWRYLLAPGFDFRLLVASDDRGPAGYAAYRVKDRMGVIADVFARDDAATALMQGAIERLRDMGAQSVHTLAVPGTRDDALSNRLGFLVGQPFNFAVCPLAPDIASEEINDPTLWQLSGGDFDVV